MRSVVWLVVTLAFGMLMNLLPGEGRAADKGLYIAKTGGRNRIEKVIWQG